MNQELCKLIEERMKEIAREVVKELIHDSKDPIAHDASTKLREDLALIKAKEHVTVKEAALLLSCSESHIRKLVHLARQGKARHPIPFADIEGLTIFPVSTLLHWASPQPHLQIIKDEAA